MPVALNETLAAHGLRHEPGLLATSRKVVGEMASHAASHRDVSSWSMDELSTHLASIHWLAAAQAVDVRWLSDATAVQMPATLFISRIDDFWYPSQDDVLAWTFDGRLLLDQEERLFVWSRPSEHVS